MGIDWSLQNANQRCRWLLILRSRWRKTWSMTRWWVNGNTDLYTGCRRELDGFKPSSLRAGKIHMPRQRLADFSSNSLSFRLINECCSTSRFVPGRGRLIGNESGFLARQNFLTGQIPHFGLHGRHTNAPRSRSAELYAAEHFFGARKAA